MAGSIVVIAKPFNSIVDHRKETCGGVGGAESIIFQFYSRSSRQNLFFRNYHVECNLSILQQIIGNPQQLLIHLRRQGLSILQQIICCCGERCYFCREAHFQFYSRSSFVSNALWPSIRLHSFQFYSRSSMSYKREGRRELLKIFQFYSRSSVGIHRLLCFRRKIHTFNSIVDHQVYKTVGKKYYFIGLSILQQIITRMRTK